MPFPHEILLGFNPADILKLRIQIIESGDGRKCYNYTVASPNDNEIVRVCRGTIVFDDRIIAACMLRFHNVDETIPRNVKLFAESKEDGTYIQIYIHSDRVCIATHRMMDGGDFKSKVVAAFGCTENSFQEIFMKLFKDHNLHTLHFEYTGPNNIIVQKYHEEQMYLLGGYLLNGDDVNQENVYNIMASIVSVAIPKKIFATLEELDKILEESDENIILEGFIVNWNNKKWKYKNKLWVRVHTCTWNLTPLKMLENVIHGIIDDLSTTDAMVYNTLISAINIIDTKISELHEKYKSVENKFLAAKQDDNCDLFNWFRNDNMISFYEDLDKNPVVSMNRRVRVMKTLIDKGMIPDVFQEISKFSGINPENWTVIGCRESSDVDIAIFTFTKTEYNKEYNMGYLQDIFPNKTIDVNIVLVEDGIVSRSLKGDKCMTNNIIFYTSRTPQKFITRSVDLDLNSMINGLSTFVLREMDHVLPKTICRNEKNNKAAAFLGHDRVPFANRVLGMISIEAKETSQDSMKSIVMKLLQILLYNETRSEGYHKSDLACMASKIFGFSDEGLLWYLFRGNRGSYIPETFAIILEKYLSSIDFPNEKLIETIEIPNLKFDKPKWLTNFDQRLWDAFLQSPRTCTPDFAKLFLKLYGDAPGTLQKIFQRYNDPIPNEFALIAIPVEQGSDEWKKIQNQYNPGTPNLPNDHPLGYPGKFYNLIRGCIAEVIASESIVIPHDFEEVRFGMLKYENSVISPDLVLVSKKDRIMKVIIYEFKCIEESVGRANLKRAVGIAELQLSKAKYIIESGLTQKVQIETKIVIVVAETAALRGMEMRS